jgi:macrolide transport system ATP-binding/permease protein
MKRLRAWGFRFAGMFSKERREQELAAEIDSHLQLHIDDNLRAGMTLEEARREALLKLGGMESTKEAYRDRNSIPFIEHLHQDLRFAIRQLQRNPGFTGTAILVLALGVAASVAIFAFVDAALLKPLPYREPSRLVGVYESAPMISQSTLSYPDYLDWKKLNKVFSSMDVYQHTGFILNTPTGAQAARGTRVSDGFFHTLGVTPILGRDFYPGEDLPGAPRTALLSYAIWQTRYGGRRDVLGRTVILDGAPNIVIGVLPRDFHFAPAEPAEFWTALHASGHCFDNRSCHSLYGVARLKNGVSVQTALTGMKLIAKQLERQYPGSNRGQGASVIPLSDVIVGDVRPILLMLLGGAGLLLLIACVNVASLVLVRSESRRREIAVRNTLGAGRTRLIRQFATEALLLVAAGSVLGSACAYWAMRLLTNLISRDMLARMPYLDGLGLNIRVLAFAGAISLLAGVLFSVAPALQLPLSEMWEGLSEGSRGSSGNTWRRLGSKLVVLELATAMVLLVGAGLLSKSLYRLLHVELAFHPDHLATLFVAAPTSSYPKDDQAVALARQLVNRITNLPGVTSVGISSELPVSGNGNTDWIRFLGRPYHGEHNEVSERDVSAGYFATLGAKLLRGRYFTDAEDESKPKVVVINQALARHYFPNEDPIGKKIGDDGLSPKSMKEIIGIVDDIREGALDSEIWPAVYYPFNQSPDVYFSIAVRTSQAEQSLLPTLSAVIHQINSGIVTTDAVSMSDRINDSPSAYIHRSSAWLVGGFAGLALVLSTVGLYGVVAYSISKRTREIGIRMALGAERNTVHQLILREAAWLALIGIVVGLLGSLGAATLMRKLLFHTQTWDIATLVTVAAVLAGAALLASYIPGRRAASINPVEALRAE